MFDMHEIPTRVPPDSQSTCTSMVQYIDQKLTVAKPRREAVWLGTQADEAFPDAWHSVQGEGVQSVRSKVYVSPKLWYDLSPG